MKNEEYYEQEGHQVSQEKLKKNSQTVQFFPYNCVGSIYSQGEHSVMTIIGTGFLVASDLVLTVAHNVYSRKTKNEYNNLIFYPGVTGPIKKQVGYRVKEYRCRKQFKTPSTSSKEAANYDYALLKLEGKVQTNNTYVELGINYLRQQEQLGIIGYRKDQQKINHQTSLWWSGETIVDQNLIKHKLSTVKGDSGSPLLVKRNGKYVAIGIHFGDILGTGYNGGRIITDDLLCDLVCWEKEMSSQIKFHLMKNNTSQIEAIQTQQRLKSISKKIGVYLQILKEEVQKLKILSSPQKTQTSVEVIKKQPQQNKPLIKQPDNILPQEKQDRHIQVKEKWLDDIVKKLQRIPIAEKQQIASLTLKSFVWNNLDVITL